MTDQADPNTETKGKPRFGCFAQAVALFFALVLLGGAAFLTWYSFSTKRLNAATTALKNAGYYGSAEELIKDYRKPIDGLNPAELWLKAGQQFEKYDSKYDNLPYIGAAESVPLPIAGEVWAEYETSKVYMDEHAEDFAIMEEAAAAKNPARFTQELVDQVTVDRSSWLTGHRSMARAVQLRCTHHAYEGKHSEVIRDIRLGLKVGQSLQGEWSVLRSMISLACTQMTLGQIEEHLHLEFTDEQLEQLQLTLREFTPKNSLLKCIEGETLRGVGGLQDVRQVGPMPRHDEAAFLAEQGLLILTAVETGDWQEISKASAELEKLIGELEQNPQPQFMMVSFWLPSMKSSIDAHQDTAAKLLVHDTLIAARRFQLTNGRLPSNLQELVPHFLPRLPIDPWSSNGSPLMFKLSDEKLKIYSVGMDQIDDGGDPSEAASGRQRDVAVELAK